MNYFVQTQGQQSGPFSEDQLRQMLNSGAIHPADFCWRDGFPDWIPISQAMGTTPPPIPSFAPPAGYAGFWLRFVAYIVDSILLFIPLFAIDFGVDLVMAKSGFSRIEMLLSTNLVGIALNWLYFASMESSPSQASLGKMILGLRVTDESGGRISFGRASGRFFGKFISALALCIGYIMAAFTARKQALHDVMAHCLVIRK